MNNYVAIDDQDESIVNKNDYSVFASFSFLFRYTRGHRPFIYFSIFLLGLHSFLSMYSATYMGRLVGDGLAKSNWDLSYRLSMFFLAFELASLIALYFGQRLLTKQAGLVLLEMRNELFKKLALLPMSFYDKWPQGRIVTRLTHDVEAVEQFFVNSLGRVLIALFLAFSAMITMLFSNFNLGLILIVSMTPALVVVYLTREKVGVINREMSRFSSNINTKLSEFVDGIFVIRSYGLESWSRSIFSSAVQSHVEASLNANRFYSWTRPVISFLCGLPIIFLIWFGGLSVLEGGLSLAVFVAFIRYTEKFFFPVLMLFREIHVIIQAFTNAQRVANFLRESEEEESFEINDHIKHLIIGDVEFSNVSMSYNGKDKVLDDVSFKITKGEKIGIVGSTGSGKTTIVSILSRLYDYQDGEVLIDGISLKDLDIYNHRSQIGLVSQDVSIFSGSLKENLSVDPNISDEIISLVSRQTGLDKVMAKAGLEFDSPLVDGGTNLSAGEKQIISIARICLLDPHILILDEATANVDPYYENIIHEAVEHLMKDKTAVIIAHRLDTISNCDRILVFEQGKLIESGTPDSLLRDKGHFYSLHEAGKL